MLRTFSGLSRKKKKKKNVQPQSQKVDVLIKKKSVLVVFLSVFWLFSAGPHDT